MASMKVKCVGQACGRAAALHRQLPGTEGGWGQVGLLRRDLGGAVRAGFPRRVGRSAGERQAAGRSKGDHDGNRDRGPYISPTIAEADQQQDDARRRSSPEVGGQKAAHRRASDLGCSRARGAMQRPRPRNSPRCRSASTTKGTERRAPAAVPYAQARQDSTRMRRASIIEQRNEESGDRLRNLPVAVMRFCPQDVL